MLVHGTISPRCLVTLNQSQRPKNNLVLITASNSPRIRSTGLAALAAASAAALVLSVGVRVNAIEVATPQEPEETLSNVPQNLSFECKDEEKDNCKKRLKIKHPKSRKAEKCTSKCVGTCILGGYGSPGEGPLNVRRPLVVFKDGFRSRKYCLSECSDICNLIGDGDDGP